MSFLKENWYWVNCYIYSFTISIILSQEESKNGGSRKNPNDESSKSSSVRNDELDLDLVPDRDWSARSSDEGKKSPPQLQDIHNVIVHKSSGNHANSSDNVSSCDDKNVASPSKKRHQFKKKRTKTLTRQMSIAKDENGDYIRNLVTFYKLKYLPKSLLLANFGSHVCIKLLW